MIVPVMGDFGWKDGSTFSNIPFLISNIPFLLTKDN